MGVRTRGWQQWFLLLVRHTLAAHLSQQTFEPAFVPQITVPQL